VPEEDEEVGALLEDVEGLLLEEESSGKESSAGLAAMHKSNGNASSPDKEEEKDDSLKAKSPLGKVDSKSPRSAGKAHIMSPKSAGKVAKESHEGDLPYELRQARALLLESSLLDENTASLLTSDMLHQLSNEQQNEEDTKQAEGEIIREDDEQQEGKYDDNEENQSSLAAGVLPESVKKEEGKGEVVLGTSPNDQMLQPSIFTMHSRSLEEE
jgi:hypothetical protein